MPRIGRKLQRDDLGFPIPVLEPLTDEEELLAAEPVVEAVTAETPTPPAVLPKQRTFIQWLRNDNIITQASLRPTGPRELLYVLDQQNPQQQVPWSAVLPVSLLAEHLPNNCRSVPDYGSIRLAGAGLGALIGIGAAFIVLKAFLALVLLKTLNVHVEVTASVAAIGSLFLGPWPGMMLGYWLAPYASFAPKPFWVARRIWDGERVALLPVEHSRLDMFSPKEQATRQAGQQDGVADFFYRLDGGYKPVVRRAISLRELLLWRDMRDMLRGGTGRWQKIQIMAVVILACVTTGILAFVLISSKGQ